MVQMTTPAEEPSESPATPVQSADPRLTVRALIHDLLGALGLERGLLRTAVDLTLRPHRVIRRHLAKPKETGSANVWSYFFLTSGLMVLVEALFPRPTPAPIADFAAVLIQYRAALLAASLPIAALATYFLFPRWRLNYAEHVVVATLITAQVQAFWLVLHPLGITGASVPVAAALGAVGLLAVTLYPAVTVFLFDQPGGRTRWLRSLAVAPAYLVAQIITTGIVMAVLMLAG